MDMSPSDPSGESGTTVMMSSMIPYLHFTRGDALWFQTIAPSSVGAVAGACIFLVLLAVFERFYAGWNARIKTRWAARYVDACACLVFLIVPKLMDGIVGVAVLEQQ